MFPEREAAVLGAVLAMVPTLFRRFEAAEGPSLTDASVARGQTPMLAIE